MYSPCKDIDKLGAGQICVNLSEPLFESFQLEGKSFMQPTCNLVVAVLLKRKIWLTLQKHKIFKYFMPWGRSKEPFIDLYCINIFTCVVIGLHSRLAIDTL